MKDGRRGIARRNNACEGVLVTLKDTPPVPDWPQRLAMLRAAAESIQDAATVVREVTAGTKFENDALDLARQLDDLAEQGHGGNSVLDLVDDITMMEGIEICQKSKSTLRKDR